MGKIYYAYKCVICDEDILFDKRLKSCCQDVVCDKCLTEIELEAEVTKEEVEVVVPKKKKRAKNTSE